MNSDGPQAAIPAATLVLVRDSDGGGPPELLMIERAARMRFAGGALVFPGGRVDEADRRLAGDAEDAEERAARIAAIRETIEETGVAAGLTPPPDAACVAALRSGLASGRKLGALLAEAGLTLDCDALAPFARWRPPSTAPRPFDTRFYLAHAPERAEPSADGTETARAFWMSAGDALAAGERGEARLIFPTLRNLERLARFASFADAAADAARYPQATIVPWIEQRDGEDWLCIPDRLGYPVTAERAAHAARG